MNAPIQMTGHVSGMIATLGIVQTQVDKKMANMIKALKIIQKWNSPKAPVYVKGSQLYAWTKAAITQEDSDRLTALGWVMDQSTIDWKRWSYEVKGPNEDGSYSAEVN